VTAYKLYKSYKYEWGPHQTSSTFIQIDKHIIQFGHIYITRDMLNTLNIWWKYSKLFS